MILCVRCSAHTTLGSLVGCLPKLEERDEASELQHRSHDSANVLHLYYRSVTAKRFALGNCFFVPVWGLWDSPALCPHVPHQRGLEHIWESSLGSTACWIFTECFRGWQHILTYMWVYLQSASIDQARNKRGGGKDLFGCTSGSAA